MACIAVIPARGGSKGIPRKNIKTLAEKPLIAHTIIDAMESKSIEQVYVSTDDTEIAEVSKKYGASVINRPVLLSGDTVSSEVALIHAIGEVEKLGFYHELVVFLQCTSPIRTGIDIDNAISMLKEEGSDSLLSVSPSHRFLWEKTNGKVKSINYDYANRPRRQDMVPQYVENGSIYIFKPWVLKQLGNRIGGKISIFPMSEAAAHEIDSHLDFEIANFLIEQKVNSNAS